MGKNILGHGVLLCVLRLRSGFLSRDPEQVRRICALWFGIWDLTALGYADDIRDVKPPVNFPPNQMWLFLLIFFILGLLSIIYFLKKGKKITPMPQQVDLRSPWQIACGQLEDLQKTSLLSEGNFKEYYARLSDIVRHYFENQFQIRAPEMTTEEFLWSLEHAPRFPSPQRQVFKDFLNSCDMVKFAKYTPRIQEAEESFRLARCLIEETK